MITYAFAANDTFETLAVRFGTTVDAILQANGLRGGEPIFVGRQLFIPAAGEFRQDSGAALWQAERPVGHGPGGTGGPGHGPGGIGGPGHGPGGIGGPGHGPFDHGHFDHGHFIPFPVPINVYPYYPYQQYPYYPYPYPYPNYPYDNYPYQPQSYV
ncbi:LysM peptidoglycan-binding domain-containing protein [Paenibacillus cymbidii]|uniref:LysM peptidoglycan-binding domain-containing protein n=1 Tax=Paenibacillus cymbidii TaxID=1639034 RepID=UPI0010808805|nr:LysM domain-containing protein [Paenibacillus cymbidii]